MKYQSNLKIIFAELILLVVTISLFTGCAVINSSLFGLPPQFPSPYQSVFQFETTGKKTVEYDILGEGYGESSGIAILGGLLYFSQPDAMKAYERAANSRGGEILLESRSQFVTMGILSPFIYTKGTIKVWGIAARLKK
ncbi:MAG: hypothetical protein ABIJ40_11635 [Bacteroidota bacterium]